MIELLLNAEVFAPEPRGVQHVLVAAGKILWVGGTIPKLPPELGVVERDLSGQRLIPGLIDGHAHVTGGGGEAGMHSRVPPLSLTRFTAGGVTTVVGVLGTDDVTRNTAALLAATRGLCEEGLSAFCHTGGYHVPPVTLTGSIRSDIVHLDRIIGVGEVAISDHRSSQPTLDELLRIASEAHVAGMMTGKAGIVHLHLGDGPRGLDLIRRAMAESELPHRVFNPTHINRRKALFDEALGLAEQGCVIDLTAFPLGPGEDGWSAVDGLSRYFAAGLPPTQVTISSDGGGCLPVFDTEGRVSAFDVGRPSALAGTLQDWLQAGRGLESFLPAVTSNVATLLRLPGKGRIGAGADADLVSLDPKGTIVNVMANGRWHLLNRAQVIRGTFEGGPA